MTEAPAAPHRRVLVIGLDGATWDLMTPWIEAGRLPHLGRLRAAGGHGPLASTIHPLTTPAWVSFMTGRQQGQTGIYDHIHRRPGSYDVEIMDATRIKAPLLFDYLGAANLRSISINMPLTYPPPPIHGLMVSGLFGTLVGPGITNPPSLYQRIAEAAPGYVVHPDFKPQARDPLGQHVQDLLESIDNRFRTAEMLLREEAWDLGIVVFTAPDQIQHAFWHAMEAGGPHETAIYDVYRRIDDQLPRLLDLAGDDALILLMSDHGAGKLHAMVNLNRWLADEGYLAFRGTRAVSQRASLIKRAAVAYKRFLPAAARAWVRRHLTGAFTRAKEVMESNLFAAPIDWEHTRAYALGACGNVFINLQGREPNGVVPPGPAYEALRDEIAGRLAALRGPEGQLLVEAVRRREEVYHGPYLDLAPDLVVIWRDYGFWGRARYDQNAPELFETQFAWDFGILPQSGTHRPDGVLIAAGPGIPADLAIEGARLIDLAPTILAYLGVPVPGSMDGAALTRLFADAPLTVRYVEDGQESNGDAGSGPPEETFRFTDEEEAKVMRRLEELGYL